MPEKRQSASAHAAASGNRSAAKAAKQKIDARQTYQLAINLRASNAKKKKGRCLATLAFFTWANHLA
jgi:hypothetical protein